MDRCEVEAIVRAAVEEVLAHVAESSHAVSERERTVLVGDEDNPSLATESYRDAGREASWAQRDFHGSWLWVAAIEALARQQFASKWAAGNVSPVRSKEHETRSWLVVKLHEFVRKVVSQADFSIDDAKWSGAFDALWTLLVEGIVVEGVYAPLYGIKLEQPVELDGGLTLRALDLGERSALYRDPTLNPRGLGLGAGDCRAALVCETRTQMGERRRPPTHTVRDVVRALRMFGHRAYAVFVRPESRISRFTSYTQLEQPTWVRPISIKSPGEFQLFWRETRSALARPTPELAVALRRFDMIFEQMRQQDRLLDQMIILEALFQLGSEKQELSYRLRLRAAHFLGDDLADRKVVASTVNKAYSLRSAIAHGATESKVKNAADIQQAMDELVPRLLRKYCREVAAGDIDGLQKRICLEMDSRVLERANDR